ncbi:ankyrin repeats (many copies) domain-containing protein [Trichoderma breve]|uniref:Ankyrin repeats (Many copies) domain-containing protein n=1 Tax=Trichoderma breve TaxID=2034170 RepID=A0A9W9JS11_9HYPO|nr:ankyrin repeats (many copies) domain-containing protein [Trichoderma breve]KAJ4865469.1 ankyrin repeats (many copies) domain-containing protein [Trichoderma breve]
MGRRDRFKERFSRVFGSGTSSGTDTADTNGHQLHRQQVESREPNEPPDGTDGVNKSPENFRGRQILDTPIRELWNMAYEKLGEQDGALIADYEAKLTESKMEEVNKDELKPGSGNFRTQAKGAMQLVLNIVNSANDYISNAASSNPYTSIAWTGVSFLLPLLTNMSEEKTTLAKGLEYVASLIVQSQMREELYVECYESGTHNHDRFRQSHTQYRTALEELYIHILRFQVTACCHYAKSSALRHALDAVKWKDWDLLIDEIREHERNFAAAEVTWRDIQRYEEHLTTIDTFSQMNAKLSALEDREFADLLKWLCDVDPSSIYNTGLDRREAGTCEWLIKNSEEFKTWETSDGSLLWLHGKAGSGKSILSSSVIKHLRDKYVSEPSTVVSYFYFSFSDPEKQKVDVMLASLTKQICSRQTQRSQLTARLRQYKLNGQRPDTETLEAVLIASASEFANVYIVIDALDECPLLNEQRAKLLKSLRRILAIAPSKFHFFFTSRKEPDIDDKIRPILSSTDKNEIDLLARQQTINRDINHYIDSQLNGDEYKSWPQSVKEEARESLVGKADCIVSRFQYVRLQLEALQSLSSESDIREALLNLPIGLDATYNRVLESIPPTFQERVIHSLKWLAFSKRVLHIEELAEIFTIRQHNNTITFNETERPFTPADILKYFSGLVIAQEDRFSEYEETSTQVRLVHFSLKEYLISERIQQGPSKAFSFIELDAELSIVRSCLAYLNHLNNWLASYTSPSLNGDVVNKSNPLARYAAHYWMTHLEGIQRVSWSPEIESDAMSALAVHSRSLLTLLIKSGANKYVTSEELDEALQQMACIGSIDMMQVFLEAGADINAQCGTYGSALQAAAAEGHLDAIKFLVNRGADVNNSSKKGECLLTCMPEESNEQLQFLLESGANINMQNKHGGTALHKAIMHGHDANVDLLLRRGADVNVLANDGTPLQIACSTRLSYSSDRMTLRKVPLYVKRLLQCNADPNLRNGDGITALEIACDNEVLFPNYRVAMEIIQLLVENGTIEEGTIIQGFVVNEDDRDDWDWMQEGQWGEGRPVRKSAVEVLKLLLENGARIDEPPALHTACIWRDKERVRWLLDQGADVNAKSDSHGTPLHAVLTHTIYGGQVTPFFGGAFSSNQEISEETVPIIQLLINEGAQVNQVGGEHGTALQAACYNDALNLEVVRCLLEHGADVNAKGEEYETALIATCATRREVDLVRLLLEHGADANAEGGEYGTALASACKRGAPELVRLLIEYGANIHQRDYAAWDAAARIPLYPFETPKLPQNWDGIEMLELLFEVTDTNHRRGGLAAALNATIEMCDLRKEIPKRRWHERIYWLLEHGADVNAKGGKYGFALQTACVREPELLDLRDIDANSFITKFLLEQCPNINVNIQGGIFGSALQAAAFSGQTESVRLLLDRGADVDARGGKCGSALNAAIFRGYWDIVEILLQRGATPDYCLQQQPDEEWLQRVREKWSEEMEEGWRKRVREVDCRCAIARYRKFWEVESGSATGTK